MKNLLIPLLLVFVLQAGYCQEQSYKTKPIMFQAKIMSAHGYETEGVLLALGDSSVQFVYLENAKRALQGQAVIPINVPVSDINSLSTRRVGAATAGALLGGLAGLVAGAIYGSAVYEPCDFTFFPFYDCEDYSMMSNTGWAALHGAGGMGIGILAGTLLGLKRKSFQLDGNIEKYRKQKQKLEKYVLKI